VKHMMAMKPVPISETLLSPTASTFCFIFLKNIIFMCM